MMATTMPVATEPRTIVLSDGLAVTFAALRVLWSLEARRFSFWVVEDELYVKPRSRLTDADDAAIREHRDELVALVRFCEVIQ
jgi:hypothetical protein